MCSSDLEVLAGTDWVLATELPVGCPRSLAARVLIVKNPGAWVGWLGTRARDGSATLAEEVRGELRRAVPPVQPRLPPAVSRRVALSADGWLGEIGLGDASWVLATTGACPGPGAPIAVLAAGIPVCTLPVNAGLERMIGVVSHPSAPVNRAHDGLTSGVEALTRAVGAAAGDLARMVWDADGPTEAVLRWLARGVPEWATNRPFARTVDGRAWTLAELRAHEIGRAHVWTPVTL